MMKNWKTTLGGILGVFALAAKHHPLTAEWSDALLALSVGMIGLAARDFNVTSEQSIGKLKQNETSN